MIYEIRCKGTKKNGMSKCLRKKINKILFFTIKKGNYIPVGSKPTSGYIPVDTEDLMTKYQQQEMIMFSPLAII